MTLFEIVPYLPQGRLPIRVTLKGLNEEDLYRILTEPVTNLIRQQVEMLKSESVTLSFTDGAIREIARVAFEVKIRREKQENEIYLDLLYAIFLHSFFYLDFVNFCPIVIQTTQWSSMPHNGYRSAWLQRFFLPTPSLHFLFLPPLPPYWYVPFYFYLTCCFHLLILSFSIHQSTSPFVRIEFLLIPLFISAPSLSFSHSHTHSLPLSYCMINKDE